jgi:hypothetical protein
MQLWMQKFERDNYHFSPTLHEEVVVLFEADPVVGSGEDGSLVKFEEAAYAALWKQYPIWICPYNASNRPPNIFELLRHSFCTVRMKGRAKQLA